MNHCRVRVDLVVSLSAPVTFQVSAIGDDDVVLVVGQSCLNLRTAFDSALTQLNAVEDAHLPRLAIKTLRDAMPEQASKGLPS